jgi:hypothetical protein
VIRICSENEQPTGILMDQIRLILMVLFIAGLFSAMVLQFLGNYLTMYNWSKIVFFSQPIIHLSLIHDFLRNSERLSANQNEELLKVIFEEICRDSNILNKQNILFGETCLHAAVDGEMFELLLEIVLTGKAECRTKNTFDQSVEQILENKYKKLAKAEKSKKELIRNILNAINTLDPFTSDEKDSSNTIWREQPMHKAARHNKLGKLCLLNSLGGQWVVENAQGLSPTNILLYNIEFEELSTDQIKSNYLIAKWMINMRDENGYCLIHHASKLGLRRCLRHLIDVGADVNVRITQGITFDQGTSH